VGIDVVVETAIYGTYTKAIGQGYTIPIFSVFVAFWSQLMLEYWKRTEATKAMEWGESITFSARFAPSHNVIRGCCCVS
jgi:hypothetical protein